MVECQRMHIERATPEQEQLGRDFQCMVNNHDSWTEEFGRGKWVAVYQEKRIALAEGIEEMFEQVRPQNHPLNLVVFMRLGDQVATTR